MDSNFNNKNEPWEFSLDIDDSDLQLTPVVRSSTSNPVKIILGPAGLIQRAKLLKDNVFILDPDGPLMSTQEYMQKVVEDVGEDADFNSGAWVSATNYVNAFGGTVTGCLGDIDNLLKKGKLEQVVAIVKSCSPNALGDLNVTLKDLSGTVPGTIVVGGLCGYIDWKLMSIIDGSARRCHELYIDGSSVGECPTVGRDMSRCCDGEDLSDLGYTSHHRMIVTTDAGSCWRDRSVSLDTHVSVGQLMVISRELTWGVSNVAYSIDKGNFTVVIERSVTLTVTHRERMKVKGHGQRAEEIHSVYSRELCGSDEVDREQCVMMVVRVTTRTTDRVLAVEGRGSDDSRDIHCSTRGDYDQVDVVFDLWVERVARCRVMTDMTHAESMVDLESVDHRHTYAVDGASGTTVDRTVRRGVVAQPYISQIHMELHYSIVSVGDITTFTFERRIVCAYICGSTTESDEEIAT
ncbi:hypothetical protein Tco_1338225 [Tanacetum coccineum]